MSTVRAGRAALVAAALAIAGCGGGALSGSPGVPSPAAQSLPVVVSPSPVSPRPTIEPGVPSPTPAGTPGPSPSSGAVDAVADVLPPPPGARPTDSRVELDDGVREITVVYRVPATVDAVRAHYRGVLRAGGWTLTGIDTDGAEWELEARLGQREAEVELRPAGGRTVVEVTVSEPAAP